MIELRTVSNSISETAPEDKREKDGITLLKFPVPPRRCARFWALSGGDCRTILCVEFFY